MSKAHIKQIIKIGISAATLGWAWRAIDFTQLITVLKAGAWGWIIPAILLFIFSKWCNAERLRMWYAHWHIHVSASISNRLYWKGMFYSLLLPGGIGGDGYKIWWLKQKSNISYRDLIIIHLADRISGVVVLVSMAIFLWGWIQHHLAYALPTILVLLVLYYGTFYIFQKKALPLFWKSLAWAFGVQMAQVASAYCIGFFLQLSTGLSAYIVVFLISSVGAALPISIGGIGIRELVFIGLAPYAMLDNETAILFSTIFFVISVCCTIPSLWIKLPKYARKAFEEVA